MMMNYCICFIEYIFLLFWGGCVPPQGECDRKPTTTAELEPPREQVGVHVMNTAG